MITIVDNRKEKEKLLSELQSGEVFIYNEIVYVKVHETARCVKDDGTQLQGISFKAGCPLWIHPDDDIRVVPVKCELHLMPNYKN